MFNKFLSWFGFCEHSYIVDKGFTSFTKKYTKEYKNEIVEFKSPHYIFHLTCFNCGKAKDVEISINDVGCNCKVEDYKDTAKTRLSLKYKIRNKF